MSEGLLSGLGLAATMNEDVIYRLTENGPSLQRVRVPNGGANIHRFCAALQMDSNIKEFYIGYYPYGSYPVRFTIDSNTAAVISNAIAKMPLLEDFVVNRCNFEDCEAVEKVASCLANKDTLLHIDLSRCNIGDKEMQVIASCFQRSNSFLSLDLSYNRIRDEGAIAIARPISRSESLEKVYLHDNRIGSKGGIAIVQAMPLNTSITRLYMSDYEETFTDEVRVAFQTALYNDESIETVLSSNHTLLEMTPDSFLCDWWWMDRIHSQGPQEARKEKINRFLRDNPKSAMHACIGFDESLVIAVIEKIGRIRRSGYLGTMFELVRNTPDLFKNPGKRPYRQCRKRSRPVYT